MKDIAFIFSIGLVLVLGITSLDRAIEKITVSAARQAGHGLPGFLSSYETALAASRGGETPVVLVFGRAGEEATERLKDEVLRSSNVNAIKERFVWAYIEAGQDLHRSAVTRFGVGKTPLTCVVDGRGNELRRIEGYQPAHAYAAQLIRCLEAFQATADHPSPVTLSSK